MSLEFIEDGHRYLLDGEEIPSVSEILRFAASEVYKDPDKFQMDQAADRGTRVHKACEELDRTGRCECDGDIEGYVKAYQRFLTENEVEWLWVEEPIYSDNGDPYAGTLDRAGYINGDSAIVDIKSTSKITKKHMVLYSAQLYAYKNGKSPTKGYYKAQKYRAVLQLKQDGTYKLIKADEGDMTFLACRVLHHEFEKTKRRKNGRTEKRSE